MCHVNHTAGVAGAVEDRVAFIPRRLIVMLNAEGLHLEAHYACQVGSRILVEQDCESKVIMQKEFHLRLALQAGQTPIKKMPLPLLLPCCSPPTSSDALKPTGNPRS